MDHISPSSNGLPNPSTISLSDIDIFVAENAKERWGSLVFMV